jgi:UDP-glucose 4-epimerase
MTRVLMTGQSSLLAVRTAQLLSTTAADLLTVGRRPPAGPLGRADYLTAALSTAQLVTLLQAERPTTVVHFELLGLSEPLTDRESAVQFNVLATMELLAACAANGVEHVILYSQSHIYGAAVTNPMLLDEQQPIGRGRPAGLTRDLLEIEQFVQQFTPRHPQLTVTVLRMAPLIGSASALVDYLCGRRPETWFGYDPLFQFLHVDDAARAVVAAVQQRAGGVFNLAAADAVPLVRAVRLVGRQPQPSAAPFLTNRAPAGWPLDVDALRYACTVDTSHAARRLDWQPAVSAAAALAALDPRRQARHQRAAAEAALRDFMNRSES